jgi:hypothetical protein
MSQNPGVGLQTGNVVSTKTALTASSPIAVSVGLTSGVALAANANRTGFVFVNTSVNNISFGIGSNPAVLNSGITLTPNGVWVSDEYNFTTSAINAIAAGAGSNLTVQEFQ